MHGILFLRCHAPLKSWLRAAVMWQMHVINKPSFVLCSFQIQVLNRRLLWLRVRLILVFVTILQKYISTLRIAWTRRCCFYHPYEKQMKGSKHLHTPACTAILVFIGFLAIPREFVENVGTRAKKKKRNDGGGGGGGERRFPLLPSPSPSIFYCSLSNFRAITQLETLVTQATGLHAQPRCFAWLISLT